MSAVSEGNIVGQAQTSTDGGNQGVTPGHIFSVMRRRARIILICTFAAGLAALVFSLLQEQKYEASASLLFREPKVGLNIFGVDATTTPAVDPDRQAATNAQLVNQDAVSARTATSMGDGFTEEDVRSQVEVSKGGDSDIVAVTATDPDPETAKKLANTYAAQFIAYRALTDRNQILASKRLLDRIISKGKATSETATLESASKTLETLASIQTGNVELVQSATVPTDYSTPKTRRNTFVGLLAGLLVGLLAAFMAERLDRRLRSPDDIEEAFGLPVLGAIPETEDIAASNRGEPGMHLPFAAAESFRMIRASLRYFNVDQEIRVVMVTSEIPQEGKSTVAWNLANVAALSGSALLIETDLRRPSLSGQHGISPAPGLAEYLTHQVGLDEVIQSRSVLTEGDNGSGSKLDVISAGTPPPNPSELLESRSMVEFLAEVKEKYDMVVIDTAPVGVVSDALALAPQSNGVLVVSRIDRTTRESATRLKQRLLRSDVPVLGVIANGVRTGKFGAYGGNFGYYNLDIDYSSEAPAPPPPPPAPAQPRQ